MRIVNKYTTCPGQRVWVINRKNPDESQTYTAVRHLTEEIDPDGNRFAVLHHDRGETSTFNLAEWKIAISCFIPMW